MSHQVTQALEIATVSLAFAAFIIYLARTQRISFRYTIGGTQSSDCGACPAGFFCPNGTADPFVCPPGYYCPPDTEIPLVCPAICWF